MNQSIMQGVKVLDLGTMITAPLAAMMLAELGAEVIKVEHPDRGDPFRRVGADLYSPSFVAYNLGKKSIQLDLRSDHGRKAIQKLLSEADVLIENYRPGVMDRLGLSESYLRSEYPRLIHCSITGFGSTGPYCDRPAYDTVAVAISGMSSLLLNPQQPQVTGPAIADNVTGIYGAFGVVAALYDRHRTGCGKKIDVNMLEAGIALIRDPMAYFTQRNEDVGPFSRVAASQAFAFRCADGKSAVVHLSFQDKFWENFIKAIEREDLATNELYLTRALRVQNYFALRGEIEGEMALHNFESLEKKLIEHDVPYAPIKTLNEVYIDPQVKHLGTFVEVTHPRQGRVVAIQRPILFDGQRESMSPPPELGEHQSEVMASLNSIECA
ncbi:MAG: Formyl-CoA:oxalate CoA-transferase [Nitrospira sp.]|nr:Formyl-CoA:oxalate CoA-transferase [Nitrospira sp.]